jgi:cold shock CspA family protein
MKLFFQNSSIDTLILASGDRDYIPMIAELKALGKQVIILAVPGTLSKDLTTIVDHVIDYEPNSKHDATDKKASSKNLETLQKFVVKTIKELEKNSINDRWVNLASIGLSLKTKDSTFSHNRYGYKKLVELLANLNGIEIKYDTYEKTNALARSSKNKNVKSQNSSLEGTILNKKDGYGFIKPKQGVETIFFHYSKLVNIKFWELNEGDKVTFTTYNTDRGLNAENIEKAP